MIAGWIGFQLLAGMSSRAAEPAAKLAYQGRISESGRPSTGTFEMRFRLFDTPEAGTGSPQGETVEAPGIVAQEGVFTALLDFGTAVFDGSPRYLEIGVRKAGSTGPYSILAPRQAITPVPYAVQTLNATPVNGLFSDAGGNVSIGSKTLPDGVRLNVNGTTRLAPGGSGGFVQVGTPNGETGVSFTGTNRADLRFSRDTLTLAVGSNSGPPATWNGLTLNTNGNFGLGMAALAPDSIWRLEVNGLTRITPHGNAGGAIQFSTPDAETGMSILGRNRGDVRFDDATLKLVAGPGNGPPGDASGLAVDTAGKVGVGTTDPRGALHVASGGVAVTGAGSPFVGAGAGLFLESLANNAGAVFAYDYATGSPRNLLLNSPGGHVGIGTTTPAHALHVESQQPGTAGIYTRATGPGGIGIHAVAPNDGRALHADGHVTQAFDKMGLVKAMVFVGPDGEIYWGWNPHGTTRVEHPKTGTYLVDLGFPTNRRFFAVSCTDRFDGDQAGASHQNVGAGPNGVQVKVFDTDDGDPTDWFFTLIVF